LAYKGYVKNKTRLEKENRRFGIYFDKETNQNGRPKI
jgi:hypothetical protein